MDARRASQRAYWRRVAEERNAARRIAYALNKDAILEAQRARAVCVYCQKNLVKRYVRRHCARLHANMQQTSGKTIDA